MFKLAIPVLHVTSFDMPPTDQTWGNREMYVRDADRNKIAFVCPVE